MRNGDEMIDAGSRSASGNVWKLILAYDGTDFRGWQVQPGELTVQGTLARVVLEITGETVLPQGSGRTDAGVHAEGQVVSLNLHAGIPPERFRRALNRGLPSSIRVLSAEIVPWAFHARADVLEKTYEYRIFQRRSLTSPEEQVCQPWLSRFVWDCRWPVSLSSMRQAARSVIGTHDFTSFAAHDPDRTARLAIVAGGTAGKGGSVRTIFSSEWIETKDRLLLYRVTGNGFLHHMVRNLVGTFVDVGAGRRDPGSIPELLSMRDRRHSGVTAPPQGLFLMKVNYRNRSGTGSRTQESAGEAGNPVEALREETVLT